MKVIFLDVDGVLNHENCPEWKNGDWRVIDERCVGRVIKLCRLTGAKIIISSTWRHNQDGMKMLLDRFGDLIIGLTPHISLNERHREISAWIMQHSTIPLDFIIIDDDKNADIKGLGRFVKTDHYEGGLTEERMEYAINLLGRV